MSEARIVLSAVDNTKAAFASLQASLQSSAGRIGALNGAVQGLLAVGAIAGVVDNVRQAINEFDRLADTAPKIGLTVQSLAELGFAAKLSGTDTATLEGALGKLSVKLTDAAGGSKEAQAVFSALGISVKNAAGGLKGSDQVLGELADKFASFKDGPEKTALAIETFGKSGKELIPFLNQGSKGIEGLREEFAKLAGSDLTEVASLSGAFNDNLDRLGASSQGFARGIIESALPALNQIIGGFISAKEGGDKFSVVGEAIKTVLETVAITGANVAYVFQTIGANIGGLAALVTANKDVKDSVYENIKADNEARRAALEKYEGSILNARKLAEEERKAADEKRKREEEGKKRAPVIKKDDPEAKAALNEYQSILASIEKRSKLVQQELVVGRQLTDNEKFRVDVEEKLGAAKSKLSATQKQQLGVALGIVVAEGERLEQIKRQVKAAQALYAEQVQFQDEVAAARVSDDNAFNARMQDARDYSRAVEEVARFNALEAEYVLATDAARARALDKLRVQITLEKQIEAIRRDLSLDEAKRAELIQRLTATAQEEIAQGSSRITLEEFRKTAGSISDGLTDAIIAGFENGKDGARSLLDFVRAQFKALVLKPTIQAIINPIAGGLAGTLGLTSGASAAQVVGSVGNASSLVSGIKTAYDTITGGFSNAAELFRYAGQDAAQFVSNIVGASESTALALDSLGASIGNAVPYVAAAYAAYQIADKLFGSKGGPKTESGAGLVYGNQGLDATVAQQISDTISTSYAQLASSLRLTVQDLKLGVFTSVDNLGSALTQLDVVGSIGGTAIASRGSVYGTTENVGRTPEALQQAISAETARVLLAALRASDLPEQFRSLLAGISDTAGLAELQQAIGRVSALRTQQIALEDRLFEATATDAEKLARQRDAERAAVDPLNRALLEQIYAAEDAAKAIGTVGEALRSAADIAGERARLVDELDKLQGNTAALRERERAAIDASNLALYDQVQALQDQQAAATQAAKAAQEEAAAQERIAKERGSLQGQIDQLLGNTAAIRERERAALDESNRALYDQIQALQAQKTAADQAAQAAAALAAEQARVGQERVGLQNQLDQLLGNTAAIRERELAALDESNRALYDQVQALQDQRSAAAEATQAAAALAAEQNRIAQQRDGLQGQIDQLLGNTAAIRERERAALDESNRALYDQVQALEASQAAASAAVQAEQALASERERVAQERVGLQNQLDQLQGNTAAIRERERAALDESNRALYDQIQALQDQKAATDAAAASAAEAAAAQDRIFAERASLLDQLAGELAISPVQVRARERAALDESNRSIYDYTEALKDQKAAVDAARGVVGQASDRLQAAYQREADAFKARIDQIDQLGQALGGFIGALDDQLRDAAGTTLLAARAEFNSLVALAKGGDQVAAGKVAASGQQLAGLLLDNAPDRVAYIRELAGIRADAQAVQTTLDGQKAEAQSRLDALTASVDGLAVATEALQTVGQAIAGLQSAREALAQAEAQQTILAAQASSLLAINTSVLAVRDVLAGRLSAESLASVAAGAPVASVLALPVQQPVVAAVPVLPAAAGADVGGTLVQEIRALREELAALRADNSAENVAAVQASQRVASILDRVSDGATALRTVVVTA